MQQLDLTFKRRTVEHLGGIGVLRNADLASLNAACLRVYELMKYGDWYSCEAILAAAGQREGLRRMRELRRWFGLEKRRVQGRNWEYRLTK